MAKCGTQKQGPSICQQNNDCYQRPSQEVYLPPTSFPAFLKMLENLDLNSILMEPKCGGHNIPLHGSDKSPENFAKKLIRDDKRSGKSDVKISQPIGSSRSGSFSKEKLVKNVSFNGVSREAQPKLLVTEFHKHPNTDSSTGLLQICCKDKKSVFHVSDNSVREMDKIIQSPATSICKDIMDNTPELILPGPYKYHVEPKNLTLNSNRYNLDASGLFIIIVDMIYCCKCVTYAVYGGDKTPLAFTQDVVKIISVMKAAFPSLFEELQKIVMYSTLVSVMKKVPLKWNRCMIHVLEYLIIHPLTRYVNEESIEFKLLTVIVQKRAKVLFKQLELDDSLLPKMSMKYRNLLQSHFTRVHSPEIEGILSRTARSSLKIHLVKKVKYILTDEKFYKTLEKVCSSYKNDK